MSALFPVIEHAQPIDVAILGIEILLLLLLAYQQIARIIHKRRLGRQLSRLFYALAEGQELQANAANITDEDSASCGKWKHAVRDWVDVTRRTLEGCSGNAVISFMRSSDPTVAKNRVGARAEYESLIERLSNLRCIMEHIDAYYPR